MLLESTVLSLPAYACGPMEYLGEKGEVLRQDSPSSLHQTYLRFCKEHQIVPVDLTGRRPPDSTS